MAKFDRAPFDMGTRPLSSGLEICGYMALCS